MGTGPVAALGYLRRLRGQSGKPPVMDVGFDILGGQQLCQAPAVAAAGFVNIEAVLDNGQCGRGVVDAGQLGGQSRMAAQFAAQLHPVAFLIRDQRAGGADGQALAAGQTAGVVDDRAGRRAGQPQGPLRAGVQACPAGRAILLAHARAAGADDADVLDLGLGPAM